MASMANTITLKLPCYYKYEVRQHGTHSLLAALTGSLGDYIIIDTKDQLSPLSNANR